MLYCKSLKYVGIGAFAFCALVSAMMLNAVAVGAVGSADLMNDFSNRASIGRGIVSVPVSFNVIIRNTTGNGGCNPTPSPAVVKGTLVGPIDSLLSPQRSATLYLHGFGLAESYFRLVGADQAVLLAQQGHVSVVIDEIGAAPSTRPDGDSICEGALADTSQQVVDELRSGKYTTGLIPLGLPFKRIAVAAHSVTSLGAETMAMAFKRIDALVVMSYSDKSSLSPAQVRDLLVGTTFTHYPAGLQPLVQPLGFGPGNDGTVFICLAGGLPADNQNGGPPHYAPFAGDDAVATESAYDDPNLLAQIVADIRLGGCGVILSNGAESTFVASNFGQVTVPVAVIIGDNDQYFPATVAGQTAAQTQAALFVASDDVTAYTVRNAGHLLTPLKAKSRSNYINDLDHWLKEHGF